MLVSSAKFLNLPTAEVCLHSDPDLPTVVHQVIHRVLPGEYARSLRGMRTAHICAIERPRGATVQREEVSVDYCRNLLITRLKTSELST